MSHRSELGSRSTCTGIQQVTCLPRVGPRASRTGVLADEQAASKQPCWDSAQALRMGTVAARPVRASSRPRAYRGGPSRAYARIVAASDPAWHALDAHSAAAQLATDLQNGLTREAVGELRKRFGANALPAVSQRSNLAVFLGQFRSPLIYLLFGAAAIALALGETKDAVVIFVVVLVNAIIGAYQEGRAEYALAALRRLSSQTARVLRAGRAE